LNYLVYNFATCIVWVLEVFFNVPDCSGYLDSHGGEGEESLLQPRVAGPVPNQRTRKDFIALLVEVALALYFFTDSTIVAVNLSSAQIHKEAKGMVIDVCLNFLAYSFLVYRLLID
jgi:hypothetical protein